MKAETYYDGYGYNFYYGEYGYYEYSLNYTYHDLALDRYGGILASILISIALSLIGWCCASVLEYQKKHEKDKIELW